MRKKISVIGLGYVGLCTTVCFAVKGYKVISSDKETTKVELIGRGTSPFYEPGLETLLKEAIQDGNLKVVSRTEGAVLGSDISFIAVGTPILRNGNVDLKFVRSSTKEIGKALRKKDGFHLVVVKSTVTPGSTEKVIKPLLEKYSRKRVGVNFGLAVNPEFLREGSAIHDFLHPNRIVIGEFDEHSGKTLEMLYREFYGDKIPILRTNPATVEMVKYASNAFLAAKISFINELANICERLPQKVDIVEVARAIGMDPRIGQEFLNAGVGWGGSCFPKDTKALVAFSRKIGYRPRILEDVIRVNLEQARRVIDVIKEEMGALNGKKIAILGLSFKPNTEDVRGAASIRVINHLIQEGAQVYAYDPAAIDNAKKVLGTKIKYSSTISECLDKADGCILVTEWEEFKKISPEDFTRLMRKPFLFDGRRIFDPKEFSEKLRFRAVGLSKMRETP